MPARPHLRHPFDIGPRGAYTVEQDSPDEVAQCVFAVLATEPGSREDAPEFGYPDPTFQLGGVEVEEIATEVGEWEPRAETLTDTELLGVVEKVRVRVAVR